MAKEFDSIIDAFLADREPDWKDLDMKDAQKSGEDILDRTHQYVDEEFMDEIAESASKHTPVPPSKSATLQNRLYEKEKAAPMLSAVKSNWHTAASEDGKAENDSESLMNEVTMSLEQAGKEGKVEKKEISDAAIAKYIKDLLNQGMAPSKVAAKLEKLAEIELFNHQSATDYLQRNAGMLGLAYLEPNTYMDKQNPNYKHAGESKDCVRSLETMKKAGIAPRAKSVKQVTACSDCAYFKKDASGKRCNLYHLPVIANTQELSQIVNQLTPGVPNNKKRAALVQIANRTDEQVQPVKVASQTNIVKTADAHVDHQAARVQQEHKTFTASHIAKLHDKGVALADVYKWADKKFGSVETSVAFRGFVQSLRKNEKGKVVVAASDLKFLNSIGIRSEKFEGAKKCASCPSHFAREGREVETLGTPMSRVEGKFATRTMDVVRGQQKQASSISFTADTVEKLHSAGHSIKKIFEGGASKVGSVQAKKAVVDFVNSIKNKPIKIALSQIDCTFLKNKLGVHNPIVGASKCADCSYRNGMHCGLTGGTLLSFPGMANAGKKQAAAENVKDGHAVLNEYDLSSPVQQPDIDISGPDRMDVEIKATFSLDE